MGNPHLELLAHVQSNWKNSSSLGLEGVLDGTTYNPATGTIHMVVGEGYTDCYNQSYSPYVIVGTLQTDQVGHQVGPQGGERAVAVPTRGGWRITLTHGEDDQGVSDAPGTPAGEHWILHPKMGTVGAGMTPVWDAGMKMTNDGPTAGDGLGGTSVGYQGALTQQQTLGGRSVALNDTLQTVQTTTPGGMTGTYSDLLLSIVHSAAENIYTEVNATTQQVRGQAASGIMSLIDGANNRISHTVTSGGLIGLGTDLAQNLPSNTAAMNESIMNGPYADLVNSNLLANLQSYITAMTTSLSAGGLPNPTAFSDSMITLIVGSWLTKIGDVTGSSLVRIATS